MIQDCTAIILAGGSSTRMGRDKANVLLGRQTLLQHVIASMRQLFPQVILSVREPRPEFDLMQVYDEPAVSGPLAGVLAAMAQVKTPWVFIVACDMPFVRSEVVEVLSQYRGEHQAVVPVIRGHIQPMAAFYAHGVLEVLRTHLAQGGKNSLRAVFEHLRISYVEETELIKADPALHSFFDLDTPDDVDLAMQQQTQLK